MASLLSILAWMGNPAAGMPPWRDEDLVAPLLILVLGVALGMCLAGLLVVMHYLRTGKSDKPRRPVRLAPWPRERDLSGAAWQGSFRWLAIRSARPQMVQEALRLHKATPVTWEEGLSATHEHKLFISPPISGWVLVLGSHLPELDDVDRCYRFLLQLSRKLGHVQFFSINRALNHHAWVQAEQGTILRGYAWAGRTVWNQGIKTPAEIELGMSCFSYVDEPHRPIFGQVDPFAANTEKVARLAARWSVDPTAIDPRLFTEDHGIAGEISRSRIP
jgi:hypothetical protein